MIYEIPINPINPYFIETITIENVAYQFEFLWSERDKRWRISILDLHENYILKGIKLVPFLPLTRRYKIEKLFSGDLVGFDKKNNDNMPSRDSLGIDFKLYYFTIDDLKEFGLDKLL